MSRKTISINNLACLLGVSRSTVETWVKKGKLTFHKDKKSSLFFYLDELTNFPEVKAMLTTEWEKEKEISPLTTYTSVELFAGAGGLALGMEKAGFKHILLNEFDRYACRTLRKNRPEWNVVEQDIHEIDFSAYRDKVDFLSGGFPCQAFSYAGKRLGFEEARGTLFFEMARAIKEINPKVFLAENVRGLVEHDDGKTLQVIKNVIADLGYTLLSYKILHAVQYDVPQKRERLFLIAVRNDLAPFVKFTWPDVSPEIRTLNDAFFAGSLFPVDVPESDGQEYPESKRKVMDLVPEGGDWRDLPDDVARSYMKGSFKLGGGKTGMARRLSFNEPSLTLTCAPAQKQTERCHPSQTRPLTVREYARIQTFPDDWTFVGSLSSQYKQIGNAVPINMAWAVGRSLIRMFNDLYTNGKIKPIMISPEIRHYTALHGLFEGMVCEKGRKYKKRVNKKDGNI